MWTESLRELRPAAVVFVLLSLVTGVVYPLVVTAVAGAIFPTQAGGSLIERDGKIVGSRLIGQPFDDERYFWGRPSATGPFPYNAGASSGSNLGPLNPDLAKAVDKRVNTLRGTSGQAQVPVDLVTASGSGLDPHISPAAAYFQVARVAGARGIPADRLKSLVDDHVESRTLGVQGERRVNVLLLNLALDELAKSP